MATLLTWTYFVRPTNSLYIIGFSAYVLRYRRAMFLPYAATGALWFAGFVAYSRWHFEGMLPSYYQAGRLRVTHFWEVLAGVLLAKFATAQKGLGKLVFALPAGALRERNFLTFSLPDAVFPGSVGDGRDVRRLGIALRWMEVYRRQTEVDQSDVAEQMAHRSPQTNLPTPYGWILPLISGSRGVG